MQDYSFNATVHLWIQSKHNLLSEKKPKKSKKKAAATFGNETESLFQIVDQANLSESDIEVKIPAIN